MTRKRLYTLLISSSVLLWILLFWFLNTRYPSGAAPALFLLILAIAIMITATPIWLWVAYRWQTTHGLRADTLKALRRGALTGVLSAILVALRILRLLTLPSMLVVLALFIATEFILELRSA